MLLFFDSILFYPPVYLSLPSCSCSVSPLPFQFFALSDMSQDSSDEDSEEEDFAQVQFGSRYTAARCVFKCFVRLLRDGPTACVSGSTRLCTNCAQILLVRLVRDALMMTFSLLAVRWVWFLNGFYLYL